jgi:hypothetical protein
MPSVLSGAKVTLTKWSVRVYWDSLGESGDFRLASKVGTWIGQNEKVLGKAKPTKVCKLVYEQFASVTDIKVEDRSNYGEIAWLRN